MRLHKRVINVVSATILSMSSLFILAPTVHAAADTCTWTGGGTDTKFNNSQNWSGCDSGTVPENGDTLHFPASSAVTTADNDITNLDLAGIIFDGAAAS